jgi:hypothetical protein
MRNAPPMLDNNIEFYLERLHTTVIIYRRREKITFHLVPLSKRLHERYREAFWAVQINKNEFRQEPRRESQPSDEPLDRCKRRSQQVNNDAGTIYGPLQLQRERS